MNVPKDIQKKEPLAGGEPYGEQKPCFKTIANFRKDNRIGFKNLFVHFREFCLDLDLYGKQTVAIDGSKFRAQNSMKNNYNQRKIDKHLDYIDQQYEDYLKELDQNDQETNAKKSILGSQKKQI